MSDSTFVAGTSKPVYFLHKLWEASITNQVTPDITLYEGGEKVRYLFRAYAVSAESGYIGDVQKLKWWEYGRSWTEVGHNLYVELPSASWSRRPLKDILYDIVKDMSFEKDENSSFTIRRFG